MPQMDSNGSFLRSIPGFGSSSESQPDLSARDRRAMALVEKALASFESLEEWADYIAFLARLQRALALPDEKEQHSVSWIPLAEQVLAKLALCLSPLLPNGVHRKALELYEQILLLLDVTTLNTQISVWLPGILPVISFGSMQVKPQVISLYDRCFLRLLTPQTLKQITSPLLLSLLCGLDDENSEVFNDVMQLIDSFKKKLSDNSHFWLTLFVCIITSPEKRLGALNWCTARLPSFATIGLDSKIVFSVEAQACLTPEPGLLIRAIAAALNTRSSFNQANDIIVMRGFFDLLLSHIPLTSPVITQVISLTDKELLIMACCRVTLRKDMSLNRRLWKWLLGPETGEELLKSEDRKAYFSQNALSVVVNGLKSLIAGKNDQNRLDAYNISLAMIVDRWEISQLITPQLFIPIITSCYSCIQENNARSDELLAAGKRFFDEVEAAHIWKYLTGDLILCSDSEQNLSMINFLLKNFNFPEDEDNLHVPLALVAFLAKNKATESTVSTLELLIELAQQKLSFSESEAKSDDTNLPSIELLIQLIDTFYSDPEKGNQTPNVLKNVLATFLLEGLEKWFIGNMHGGDLSERIASLLCDFLNYSEREANAAYLDQCSLKTAFLEYPANPGPGSEANAPTIFGMLKLYRHLEPSYSLAERSKMLQIVLTNLSSMLTSLYPANFQVEAVKSMFELRLYFDPSEIEAGISHLLLQSDEPTRLHSFYKLWNLAQDMNEPEDLLSNPLFVALDTLRGLNRSCQIDAQKLVRNICIDGSANRLLKIVTSPLLAFPLMWKKKTVIDAHDDLKLFAYHIETILNLLKHNEKHVKDILAHEFVSSESADKFDLFSSNGWDVSNYKSFLLEIVRKCLKWRISESILADTRTLSNFTECISTVLELYTVLITGSEPDFQAHFDLLVTSCLSSVSESKNHKAELSEIESMFLKYILEFLKMAKTMNVDLIRVHEGKNSDNASFTAFLNRGLNNCSSPVLLEKWLSLMKMTLHLLGNSIYSEMLNFNNTIIKNIYSCFECLKSFEKFEKCNDSESYLSTSLTGVEDLLAICHSYLVSPKLNTATQPQQAENGFFGNVILGVFQIESPLVKSEEEQRAYAVVAAFQDALKVAFDIWCWADSKPHLIESSHKYSSQKSITHMSNKLKFRSKKLLECLSELERQEIIETVLETKQPIDAKIKILHVLDSGHSQLSLPNILNSILTRCSPQIVSEKDRSTMYSGVTQKELCEFLVPYYDSIDLDTLEEIWDMSLSFFREVSSHPSHFKGMLLTILQTIKVVSLKAQARKWQDEKRNMRDLTNSFLSILNATVSKKVYSTSSEKKSVLGEKATDAELDVAKGLISLVESFGDILQDQDKITTAVTTIISTIILAEAKPKATSVAPVILQLLLTIGKRHPIKAWKQVILDTFVDASFFDAEKFLNSDWQEIIATWIRNDRERMGELVGKITPPVQSSAANIFIWNEKSEVDNRVMVLRRISYLLLIQPKDSFVKYLEDIMGRLASALNSSCPALYRSEALMVFRAISLRFSEGHLLPYWSLVIQNLVEVFSEALGKSSKQFGSIDADGLALILSACKLLDQLLLIQFDEVNLTCWLFVSRGSVSDAEPSNALIDRLAKKSETLLTKEDPVNIYSPLDSGKARPLLLGVSEIKNIAHLKKFFGLLGYINFERSYGLCEADLDLCQEDLLKDMRKR